MMHIEIQTKKDRKHYYLAHAIREGQKVKKIRKYLGADLTPQQIEQKKPDAEEAIRTQIQEQKKIRDPLHAALTEKDLQQIQDLIQKTEIKIRHLSEKDWNRFTEQFTYDTNAIEGSTITQNEVADIIEKDKWPTQKTRAEIAETYGVAEAIKHIRKTPEHISIEHIEKLHALVFKNSKTYAGRFREKGTEVAIKDAEGNIIHRGAPQPKIRSLLKELVDWYHKNKGSYHPIVLAAVIHNQFENIHPFPDGNGRIGRLLLNNILLKHGLPPVNIELRNRTQYYQTLQAYQKEGDIRPTIELIIREYKKQKGI
jgi:Fic family protein